MHTACSSICYIRKPLCEAGYNQDWKRHLERGAAAGLWPITLQSLFHSPPTLSTQPSACRLQSTAVLSRSTANPWPGYPTVVFLIFCLLHLPPLGRQHWFSIFYLGLFLSLPLPHLLIVLIAERLPSVLCSSSIVTQVYRPFLRIQQPSLLTLPRPTFHWAVLVTARPARLPGGHCLSETYFRIWLSSQLFKSHDCTQRTMAHFSLDQYLTEMKERKSQYLTKELRRNEATPLEADTAFNWAPEHYGQLSEPCWSAEKRIRTCRHTSTIPKDVQHSH